jgi:hypothetical protein
MIGILVLFNPLPIHLRRATWRLIDLVVAATFIAVIFALRRSAEGSKPTTL